jgi:hypothetical protein
MFVDDVNLIEIIQLRTLNLTIYDNLMTNVGMGLDLVLFICSGVNTDIK